MLKIIIIAITLLSLNTKTYDRIRHVDGDDIMADVQSHLPADHKFTVTARDYGLQFVDQDSLNISTVHECTHGINSILRENASKEEKYNGFYLLNNEYVIFKEPNLNTLRVLEKVPKSLRLDMYNVTYANSRYISKNQPQWEDRPLYLTDEFIAHTTGMLYRHQKNIKIRTECPKYALEMGIYNLFLLQEMKGAYSSYEEFRDFIKWNFLRILDAYNDEQGFKEHLAKLKNDKISRFILDEFGEEFYNRMFE